MPRQIVNISHPRGSESLVVHKDICTAFQRLRKLMNAPWQAPTPLSIGLEGSTAWSLQCVACVTGVVHYRVHSSTGESASAICGSTGITTITSRKYMKQLYSTMSVINT